MKEWQGKLTKQQAIQLLERITYHDDPYWENIVDDYYDESSDTMPSIYHLYIALGITEQEYRDATGADNPNWPEKVDKDVIAQRDRLLVLATKHCPRDHHDWQEILRLAMARGISIGRSAND